MTLEPLPESVNCPGGEHHRAALMETLVLGGSPCGYYQCADGAWWLVGRYPDGRLAAQWGHPRAITRHPLLEGLYEDPMTKWNS